MNCSTNFCLRSWNFIHVIIVTFEHKKATLPVYFHTFLIMPPHTHMSISSYFFFINEISRRKSFSHLWELQRSVASKLRCKTMVIQLKQTTCQRTIHDSIIPSTIFGRSVLSLHLDISSIDLALFAGWSSNVIPSFDIV